MSMSMNIHNVDRIVPGEINSATHSDGTPFYWRSFDFFDAKGVRVFCIDAHSSNGYNLLITDPVLDEMNAELPLLKAA